VIEDSPGRLGNAVVVSSRAAGDVVSAAVINCEIINPNRSGRLLRGPIGRGLVVVTRNPDLNLDPPPHDGASLFLDMRSSIVRAPEGGSGVFAANFSSHSQIGLVLTGNVIGGGLDASAGIGRPEVVFASRVFVESRGNLYRSDTVAPTPVGWILTGGADAPLPGLISEGARLSALYVHSVADRIDGFDHGVEAAAGRKFSAVSASSSENYLELELHGTEIVTVRADLQVFGARTLAEAVTPGDGNVLRLLMRHANGSGGRDNEYAHSWSPSQATPGLGNRLEVIGGVTAFAMTNDDLLPSPPTEFFAADAVGHARSRTVPVAGLRDLRAARRGSGRRAPEPNHQDE
jgi:hypothetical protein